MRSTDVLAYYILYCEKLIIYEGTIYTHICNDFLWKILITVMKICKFFNINKYSNKLPPSN